MKSIELETTCPYCGYVAELQAPMGSQQLPKLGDISFCINCGNVSKYDELSRLEKTDLCSLDSKDQEAIAKIKTVWRATKS